MKNKIQISILIVGSLMLFLSSKDVKAATLSVPSQYSNISSAIKKALPGDTVLVSAGTYNERLWISKNIEIRSVSGPENTVINAQDSGSVVVFYQTSFDGIRSAKISGFTIRDGYSNDGQGGGVTFAYSDAVVENNHIISNNAKVDGGGILVSLNSSGVIRNNFIDSNSATRFGAGIMVVNNSNPLVYNNHISNNNASGPTYTNGGAGGGAMYVDGNSSPQIIKNTITTNHADHAGGAISLRVGCSSVIEENTITNNNAAYGGGIHIETEGGSPTIKNNIISNNQANASSSFSGSGFGGGVSIFNGSKPQIIGNTINNNSSSEGGAGIVSAENANSTIADNKIFSNKVPMTTSGYKTGGGIYVANSTANIFNNVIYANEASLGGGIGLLDNANVAIVNNTIVKNIVQVNRPVVSAAGGISVMDVATSVSIKNNIITQNGEYQVFEEHKKATLLNNLINNDGKGLYFNWDTALISDISSLNSESRVNADWNVNGSENFIDSSNNNYAINSSSAGVDKGDTILLSQYAIDYSLRNFGSTPDIGAYEYTTVVRKTKPIYRFWSNAKQHHFYTISIDERNTVLNTYALAEWKYEGQAFRAFDLSECGGASQVFRFWSDEKQGHFYTINASEKDYVDSFYPDNVWRYEAPAYCAETSSNGSNTALYRFWSDEKQGHFYTASAGERDYITASYPANVWRYESVGYYVYPNL